MRFWKKLFGIKQSPKPDIANRKSTQPSATSSPQPPSKPLFQFEFSHYYGMADDNVDEWSFSDGEAIVRWGEQFGFVHKSSVTLKSGSDRYSRYDVGYPRFSHENATEDSYTVEFYDRPDHPIPEHVKASLEACMARFQQQQAEWKAEFERNQPRR
jgi:hypothetical protein